MKNPLQRIEELERTNSLLAGELKELTRRIETLEPKAEAEKEPETKGKK